MYVYLQDEGGWNNIRMSMETAVALAHAMGRILVLPPVQSMYLLNKHSNKKKNLFTFHDFFHLQSVAQEHPAVDIISFEEFLKREGLSGHLRNKHTGKVEWPPQNNRTNWDSDKRSRGFPLWDWLRNVTTNPIWFFDDCVVALPNTTGPEGHGRMLEYIQPIKQESIPNHIRMKQYDHRPTPVDASPKDRLREMLAHRKDLCVYGDVMQNARVFHLMGDNASGARLLVHFYLFLFFESWQSDLWTKVRRHSEGKKKEPNK